MQDFISQAKQDFLRAKQRLLHSFATTPDDRINWSPSPTARTPVQIVGHVAMAVESMQGNWEGRTFAIETTAEAERYFRESEKDFRTREEVLALLDKNSDAYIAWLESLPAERLSAMVDAPFGLGQLPVSAGIGFMPQHVAWHAAQIDYIQTIYGDQDWHM